MDDAVFCLWQVLNQTKENFRTIHYRTFYISPDYFKDF